VPGHDQFAKSAVIDLKYGSVADFIVESGFGPTYRLPYGPRSEGPL
jgi:hypothetical protein